MKNLTIIAIFSFFLISCETNLGGSSSKAIITKQVAINGESDLIVPIQVSPAQIQPVGGSDNFCYTIGADNVLYYYYQACSPNMLNARFESINLAQYYDDPRDLPVVAASDESHNIYIGMSLQSSNSYNMLKCNITNLSCAKSLISPNGAIINFFNPYIGFWGQLTNDAFGNIYTTAYDVNSHQTYTYMSNDGANTWSSLAYNLNGLSHVMTWRLAYNTTNNTLFSWVTYDNNYGQQDVNPTLQTPNGTSWNTSYPKFPFFNASDAIAFSKTGYLYTANHSLQYYESNQFNSVAIQSPANTIIPSDARIHSISFDNQNNIYITYTSGQTFWASAPI